MSDTYVKQFIFIIEEKIKNSDIKSEYNTSPILNAHWLAEIFAKEWFKYLNLGRLEAIQNMLRTDLNIKDLLLVEHRTEKVFVNNYMQETAEIIKDRIALIIEQCLFIQEEAQLLGKELTSEFIEAI